jgi:hypothetical protein
MPFASIWLGLGLALTSIIGNCRLTLKTCAVPGTQQKHSPDGENVGGADAASSLAPLVMQDVGRRGIEIKITISGCIAALALIVSLLSFGISLYFGLRDRVHLRAISKLYNLSGEFGPAYIEVKVVNRGRRPAILTMFGGELDNGGYIGTYLGEKGRGIRLEENEYHISRKCRSQTLSSLMLLKKKCTSILDYGLRIL